MADDVEGKKVFFLYPHKAVSDDILEILIMGGFECYTLRDHRRAGLLLARFPGSILFINIDEGMKEGEWETYVKNLLAKPKTKESRLGIISNSMDEALLKKYKTDIGTPCGYIQLKLGIQQSIRSLLEGLRANEARGRRKYIRVDCQDEPNATMNYKYSEGTFQGKLLDISVAGIAARIAQFPIFPANTALNDIQLKLKGQLIMVDGILMGNRRDDKDVWILLFDSGKMSPVSKQGLTRFIKMSLQKYIDQLMV
ncbi:hypothetical protein AGMMS50268_24260 [Spirochaetia bacterium]|nr:hypothetical protein AGMMS50268_24260 [Spirochaetia bacterium]